MVPPGYRGRRKVGRLNLGCQLGSGNVHIGATGKGLRDIRTKRILYPSQTGVPLGLILIVPRPGRNVAKRIARKGRTGVDYDSCLMRPERGGRAPFET